MGEPWSDLRPEWVQDALQDFPDRAPEALARRKSLCHFGTAAFEPEDVEYAGEVVAECHQAPFTADFVEAAYQEMAIARAALERAKWMFDNCRTTAHQFA